MTREEAIKCIEEDGIRLGAGDFVDVEALKVAVECMKEKDVTDTNVENKWISVKDRLPEDGVRVLTACDDGIVRLNISKGGFPSVINRQHRFSDVTHWMPLPEPPKEDAG